jgi:hypothetical protein
MVSLVFVYAHNFLTVNTKRSYWYHNGSKNIHSERGAVVCIKKTMRTCFD